MPNHIQNRLEIIGSVAQIKAVTNSIKGEENAAIDFNKIIPMPDGLSIEINSNVGYAVKWALKMEEHSHPLIAALASANAERSPSPISFNDKDWGHFIQCLQNVRNHGYIYWYDWAVSSWGTKWGAYQTPDDRDTLGTVYFQTAWSAPVPVITKLSELFPLLDFTLSYADEDSGSNTGILTFKGGKLQTAIRPVDQSKQAYDLYFELHPDSKSDYKLVGDTYEYIDEP